MFLPLQLTIQAEIANIVRASDEVAEDARLAVADDNHRFWRSAALGLHSIYVGMERIFEQIAGTLDGGMATGHDWHRQLLAQMTQPAAGVRPAVLRHATAVAIDDLRRFRHVIRYGYAFDLDYDKVRELTLRLPGYIASFRADLDQFLMFLATLDPDI